MARHRQLKDILHAHHLIGNIDSHILIIDFITLQVTQTTVYTSKGSQ